jgi:hypothetical protein
MTGGRGGELLTEMLEEPARRQLAEVRRDVFLNFCPVLGRHFLEDWLVDAAVGGQKTRLDGLALQPLVDSLSQKLDGPAPPLKAQIVPFVIRERAGALGPQRPLAEASRLIGQFLRKVFGDIGLAIIQQSQSRVAEITAVFQPKSS